MVKNIAKGSVLGPVFILLEQNVKKNKIQVSQSNMSFTFRKYWKKLQMLILGPLVHPSIYER